MLSRELERGILPTPTKSAEKKASQPLETARNLKHPLIEFTGNLQTSKELQQAGWDSSAEIKRFIGDVNLGLIKGLTLEEAVVFSSRVFAEHIRFYDAEFIKQEPLLPHHNYFGDWQGKKRVLGNNGRPAEHAIDPTERLGAAKRTAQKAENFLVGAENNSMVISMSVQGKSGYLDESGNDIPHLNTYILVDWVDQDKNLKGVTLVTDLTVDQAEELMVKLGAPANLLAKTGHEMQRLANLLENPATPSLPEQYHSPLIYVFDQMIAVRGEEDIHLKQKKGPDEIRSVAEIRRKLACYEAVLDLNANKDKLIREFTDFVTANYQQVIDPSFHQQIIKMAEETVLLFAKDYRLQHQSKLSSVISISPAQYNHPTFPNLEITRPPQGVDREAFFAEEIAFLQTRAGCPSSRNSAAGRSRTSNTVSILGESDSKGSLYFACPVCGAINKRPWEGFVENCQSCGTDKVGCKPTAAKSKGDQTEDQQLPKAA